MSIVFEERLSDSPYVETITHGWTASDGSTIRPAEVHWHLVLVKHSGGVHSIVVGPWASAGVVHWKAGAEVIWIRFKLGTFMPHLPTRKLLASETMLPQAAGKSFWLKGSAWQFPNHENADTFVNRLAREDVLVSDPVVSAALHEELAQTPARTVRHRFLHATGLTQSHIRQVQRAQQAAALLRQGVSILDTVYEAGYFDQPHLTRSLKQFIGYTPAQIIRMSRPCHSVQDAVPDLSYDTDVLENIV
ncbi:MAG: helix-turn-helix domain-containing protein [Anaerolineae bacterium]